MQLLEDALLAALAALGLATLLFALLCAAEKPRCAQDAVAVVPCRGTAAELEQTVRALERAREAYGGFRRIVILDLGMDEEARATAALLCRDAFGVTLCRRGALYSLFTQEEPT